jgi:NAD(P)-dependent dehydrogenase (short-subunit alcohol dehydrogenase family)
LVRFDDPNLVSCAGLVPVMTLAQRCGLTSSLVERLTITAKGGVNAALETLSIDSVRRQFETNVFGALRMAQLVLPGMRAKGAGTIVNISSMGGKFTVPGAGATTPPSTRWRR